MIIPKTVKRYCPYCKKHSDHKVKASKKATPGSAHPLSHGSKIRQRARGVNRGFGNHGRYSRKPVNARKRGGRKTSKKTDLRYECSVCKRMHVQKKGIRTKKLEIK
jgi:large subunit ribosomal protein L44e